MPSQQKALIIPGVKEPLLVDTVPVPTVVPGELLVRVEATALNPVDWKIWWNGIIVKEHPAIIGSDAAGVVEEVGEGVTNFVKGDRVVWQGEINNTHTGFQQYTLVHAEFAAKIPERISFDEAATIPVGLITAYLTFHSNAKDKSKSIFLSAAPWEEGGRGKYAGQPFVVLGGSASVGQYAIQLARLYGFSPIITTASPRNTAFLNSLGATHVLDRSLPSSQLLSEILRLAGGHLRYVYDAVSLPDTQVLGYDALAPGGTLALVLFTAIDPAKLTPTKTIVKAFGNSHDPDQREAVLKLYQNLSALLERGEIKPNRTEILPNGLEGIIEGLQRLKNDQVSGAKLVAHPQETA